MLPNQAIASTPSAIMNVMMNTWRQHNIMSHIFSSEDSSNKRLKPKQHSSSSKQCCVAAETANNSQTATVPCKWRPALMPADHSTLLSMVHDAYA
jgi:hypothetical protein